ncbi:hypothetical protein FDB55_03375 [Clostridium botulinum]|uniref:hypothetical protein n=1 Tax=Clostridium botulinum TaxID=1491 RepID=UPI0006A6CD0C|nr:hypothetical protein [Clostridium botulinum]KAI3350134.1 hypothetical protein CIT18_04455 [Clostridium botulinum]KOM88950.1 hypothetical protein ACP51_04240 [Clostridium botulinum]KOR63516.1 hypothetical protein ADT22_03025 [Clostridium botulinum]MCS6111530.1 hypothetical protein [Clostridium botulinum]NFE10950.1 hypothetical protein [Clostridium botulinum]
MSKNIQKLKLEDYLKENENNLKIIKASINKFLKELSEGNIKIDDVADFEKLVKLDTHLKEQDMKYRNFLRYK